jgi:two-component SAPR family response regulator
MKNCIYSKIIIIDKDFIGTMILQKLIQKNFNCEVLHFKHYELAYEYFAKTTIQYKFLVFSDIYNIDNDATDFLIKYQALNRSDSFYILTASIDPNDKLIAAQFNFISEFIPKPIAWDKLKSILDTALLT